MNNDEALSIWTSILVDGREIPPTEAVLVELSEYSGKTSEEVRQLASTAPSITKKKWEESDHSTPEGLTNFYNGLSNWVYGTLSYHARQAERENLPLPVQAAVAISNEPPGDMLDFGCGVATACLLFAKMGWRVAAADISTPLLDFAQWRFKQRGLNAKCIDLKMEQLGSEQYDLITAFNTMAHVPDVEETLHMLRTALRTRGKLIFDVDARKKSQGNEWHLYETNSSVIRQVRRLGFAQMLSVGSLYVYERRELSPPQKFWFNLVDEVRYSTITNWLIEKARRLRRTVLGSLKV